jgi:membrane associated rhomboid family serine protease
MIPLRDTIPSKKRPFFTWTLIALNIAVFVWEMSLGPGGESAILQHAFVPARFFGAVRHAPGGLARVLPVFSSMFLHGGWLHLLGNMLYLYIFGDNVEDAFGHGPFLVFYFVCGSVSALSQGLVDPRSTVPMVGASGAVAGVLGAYFVLYPHARVLTLVPIFIFFQLMEIPAFFFLLFWFLLQFVSGALSSGLGGAGEGGVAFWAHVGGFAVGLFVALIVRIARASK